eukprot:TRINITY_DN11687_c0_g1_i3.p1 TRINITY_DN11687_c0_g1~~TRINITY_DN11687_c0_g1_i3.p1  ORF type:complete len:257 (-),score=44.41 TRINITY_DN11687_c0_g1_i3:146-916(-)
MTPIPPYPIVGQDVIYPIYGLGGSHLIADTAAHTVPTLSASSLFNSHALSENNHCGSGQMVRQDQCIIDTLQQLKVCFLNHISRGGEGNMEVFQPSCSVGTIPQLKVTINLKNGSVNNTLAPGPVENQMSEAEAEQLRKREAKLFRKRESRWRRRKKKKERETEEDKLRKRQTPWTWREANREKLASKRLQNAVGSRREILIKKEVVDEAENMRVEIKQENGAENKVEIKLEPIDHETEYAPEQNPPLIKTEYAPV